jgi:hypothetical protein
MERARTSTTHLVMSTTMSPSEIQTTIEPLQLVMVESFCATTEHIWASRSFMNLSIASAEAGVNQTALVAILVVVRLGVSQAVLQRTLTRIASIKDKGIKTNTMAAALAGKCWTGDCYSTFKCALVNRPGMKGDKNERDRSDLKKRLTAVTKDVLRREEEHRNDTDGTVQQPKGYFNVYGLNVRPRRKYFSNAVCTYFCGHFIYLLRIERYCLRMSSWDTRTCICRLVELFVG